MASCDVTGGIFVGVDSGGTRTNVQIVIASPDRDSRTNRSYEVSESLSGALPTDLIPITLRRILAPLEQRLGREARALSPIYIWISAAGFSPWSRDNYLTALNELMPSILDGNARCIGVGNDAVSLLLGSRADGIIIAGTGSSVIVRSSSGDLHQAGGHEWVACDSGSGFWIGLRAIRQAYRDYEDGDDSVLLQRMRQLYDLKAEDDRGLIEKLRDLAIGDRNLKKEIARFAAAVCAAAERGDEGAQDIVKIEAEDLADVTAGAIRRTIRRSDLNGKLRMVQCGSLLGNSFYRNIFEKHLEMRLLPGSDEQVLFDWHRVITGGEAAVQLAQDIAMDASRYLHIGLAFRPAVVQL